MMLSEEGAEHEGDRHEGQGEDEHRRDACDAPLHHKRDHRPELHVDVSDDNLNCAGSLVGGRLVRGRLNIWLHGGSLRICGREEVLSADVPARVNEPVTLRDKTSVVTHEALLHLMAAFDQGRIA